jgi:hypothetical protein
VGSSSAELRGVFGKVSLTSRRQKSLRSIHVGIDLYR